MRVILQIRLDTSNRRAGVRPRKHTEDRVLATVPITVLVDVLTDS